MTTILNEVENHHFYVMSKLQPGQTILFTGLYGSQNYGADTPQSDVDTKTIVLPSFEDLVRGNSEFAYELTMPDGSLCNVLSLYSFARQLTKGSINFVELIFTDFVVVTVAGQKIYSWLKQHREELARINQHGTLHACMGHLMSNYKDYLKPNSDEKKIVANMLRLAQFMRNYASDLMTYKELLSVDAPIVKDIRNGCYTSSSNDILVSTCLSTAEQYVNACRGLGENAKLIEEMVQQVILAHWEEMLRGHQ